MLQELEQLRNRNLMLQELEQLRNRNLMLQGLERLRNRSRLLERQLARMRRRKELVQRNRSHNYVMLVDQANHLFCNRKTVQVLRPLHNRSLLLVQEHNRKTLRQLVPALHKLVRNRNRQVPVQRFAQVGP